MSEKEYPKSGISLTIQRPNDIVAACERDKVELLKAGLTWKKVQMLAELVPVLINAQALYQLQCEVNTA